MAKGYTKQIQTVKDMKIERKTEIEFINSRGIKVLLRSIPPFLLQSVYGSFEVPEPPTYSIAIEGGETEVHKHDEESIQQSSEEEKTEWAAYKQRLVDLERSISETMLNLILLEGVEVKEVDDSWAKRQKLLGVEVPEDPVERDLHYKRTNVIASEEDASEITRIVTKMSKISREDVDAMKESFPDQVESESLEEQGKTAINSEDA